MGVRNAVARGVSAVIIRVRSTGDGEFTVSEASSPMLPLEKSKRGFPRAQIQRRTARRAAGNGVRRAYGRADPMFVDPANDDYRLRANSPALKLGFQPIDLSKIGPRAKPRAPK